jgi:hypothetical protein
MVITMPFVDLLLKLRHLQFPDALPMALCSILVSDLDANSMFGDICEYIIPSGCFSAFSRCEFESHL